MARGGLRTLSVEHGTLPMGGLDTTSNEDLLSRMGRSRVAQNVLFDRRGKVRSRGGVSGALTIPALRPSSGFWPSPAATLSSTSLLFAKDSSTLQVVTLQTPWSGSTALGATFALPATISSCAQMRPDYAVLNGFTYGFVDTKFIRWDGTAATAGVVGYTNAPTGGTAIATHLNRVFVGGAKPAGATASNSDRVTLTWSDNEGPITDTLVMWQDDVSGLTNKIVLDDPSDVITGLVSWNGRLYILRNRSVWALVGSSPSDWTVRKVSDVGSELLTSVAETMPYAIGLADGLYFINLEGLFKYDGAGTRKVSVPVDDSLNAYPSFNALPGIVALSATKLLVNTAGAAGVLVYDTEVDTWSTLSTSSFGLGTSSLSTYALGRSGSTPWVVVDNGSGGGFFIGLDTLLNSKFGYDPTNVGGTTRVGIPVHVRSAPLHLSAPESVASLHKLTVDYYLTGISGHAAPSLNISVLDDAGATIFTKTEAGQVYPTNTRQRKVYDVLAEVSGNVTLDFQITYTGADATLSEIGRFELLDASIEFQPGQDVTG